ncbi:hypothetical protein [uncultured Fibrobacter sp.]|uniref:hypothetical protein n=1 Tax=uncultured Fibrobacter sp. TaxID=261512 RepID=UPI0025FA2418|nr:hypothetical protein [uncultured Fibrobacter sp.]
MIPVKQMPEPPDFDEKVRKPGNKWLADPINANVNPSKYKNFWTRCLPDLAEAYGHMCAYLAIYFDPAFGADSVDHFIPKSDPIKGKSLTYEWSNYRLSCLGENRKKNVSISPIDPFTMEPESFFIDFSDGHVFPNPAKDANYQQDCKDAIIALNLNNPINCKMRKSCYLRYLKGEWTELGMQRESPFVWQEICRQGLKK